jgi:alpha-beta hydrolase superfamily lysophospholipase
VYLLHGLGEHSGRHEALARWFAARGWIVRAHDHVGHGRSEGRRGVIADPDQLARHAERELARFAADLGSAPLLFGHSLGGALAAELVVHRKVPVRGLILSSPALATGMTPGQRALAAVLGALAPSLAVGNGLEPSQLSHDPEVVRAYLEDPLVHDRISARLVRWLVRAGERARALAHTLEVPTLLLVAGSDRLVDPVGSRTFFEKTPGGRAQLKWYADMRHEILNETADRQARVLDDLEDWLKRLDARTD